MNKRQRVSMIRRLQKAKDALEKQRDSLRDFQSEIEEMADIAADAAENISYAIDRLSEQV